MHIEPGLVTGAKLVLGYVTAAAAAAGIAKLALDDIRMQGPLSLLVRASAATALVLVFFEVLPHFPVGVSEVHFIMGSTLFLVLGPAAAGIGLAVGLLLQGLLLEPQDLPQYGMNVTTLLVPLLAINAVARRVVPADTPYVDLRYGQALTMSAMYQAGVVGWVAFWALLGHGFEAGNLAQIASFAAAYTTVLLVEPIADLAVLAAAKSLHATAHSRFVTPRLHSPETLRSRFSPPSALLTRAAP